MRTLLFVPFTAASTFFFSTVAVVGGLLQAPKGWYDWVHRNWSRSLLWAAGVEVRVMGLSNLRPGAAQILVSNHQSMFDIWALMSALPISLRFVAKRELSRIPVFARACRSAGHVFIDRQDRAAAVAAIRRAGDRMRAEGLSLVFFPEGTRSPEGDLRSFKRGPFVLAIETQTTLVPVALNGGARILPKGQRRLRPGPLVVRCGKPIPLAGLTVADRDEVLAKSRQAIERMLDELRSKDALSVPKGSASFRHGAEQASAPAADD